MFLAHIEVLLQNTKLLNHFYILLSFCKHFYFYVFIPAAFIMQALTYLRKKLLKLYYIYEYFILFSTKKTQVTQIRFEVIKLFQPSYK